MEHIWELTTESPEQTEAFGEKLAAQLKGGEVIACLEGWEWEKQPLSSAWPEGWE